MVYRSIIYLLLITLGTGQFSLAVADNALQAAMELEGALLLTPDIENGKKVYRTCAVCHQPEAWGKESGYYPQVAGQIGTVIIKQLADIRARNRDNPTMLPFTRLELLSLQEIADVSAYIANLPMTRHNGSVQVPTLYMEKRSTKTIVPSAMAPVLKGLSTTIFPCYKVSTTAISCVSSFGSETGEDATPTRKW